MVLGHSAGNVLNDVCDDRTGNDPSNHDRISPFTGGSRTIPDGLLSRRRMAGFVVVQAVLDGVGLVAWHGWAVLAFGLSRAAPHRVSGRRA